MMTTRDVSAKRTHSYEETSLGWYSNSRGTGRPLSRPVAVYAVPGARGSASDLVHRGKGSARLRTDRNRQDVDRPGGAVRGITYAHRRILHDAADRVDRAEVPRDAGCRRPLGLR